MSCTNLCFEKAEEPQKRALISLANEYAPCPQHAMRCAECQSTAHTTQECSVRCQLIPAWRIRRHDCHASTPIDRKYSVIDDTEVAKLVADALPGSEDRHCLLGLHLLARRSPENFFSKELRQLSDEERAVSRQLNGLLLAQQHSNGQLVGQLHFERAQG